jgi:hypothetical protein
VTSAIHSAQLLTAPIAVADTDDSRARRRAGTVGGVAVPVQQTLPLQASIAGHLSAPRWLFVAGGAAVGFLLLSLPGAVLGAVAGYLLTR